VRVRRAILERFPSKGRNVTHAQVGGTGCGVQSSTDNGNKKHKNRCGNVLTSGALGVLALHPVDTAFSVGKPNTSATPSPERYGRRNSHTNSPRE
jgi:hypothetical protein